MEEKKTSSVADMLDVAQRLIAEANQTYHAVRLPCGSRALAFAVEAGLKPKMAYTVAETARYSGVDVKTLYEERSAGRLHMIIPLDAEKGYRIAVDEMDRWMAESTR